VANLDLRQVKFAGEVSPQLWGDTSHPKYGSFLALCKNWLPLSQGAVMVRPGTTYKAATRTNSYAWPIPFVFSDGLTYVLLFTDSFVQFFRNGSYLGEMATPWTLAMLPYLKYAQVGNVITLVYGGQGGGTVQPKDLIHTSGVDFPWTLVDTPLAPLATGNWSALPFAFNMLRVDITTYDNTHTYDIGDRVFSGNTEWISIQTNNLGNAPASPSLFWQLASDTTHVGSQWRWVQTKVVRRDADGVVFETLPTPYHAAYTGPIGLDRPIPVHLDDSPAPLGGYTVLYNRLYRGNNDVYGWIADIKDATTDVDYIDRGTAPDYTQQPPTGENPFIIAGTSYWPSVVSHYDQRRLLFHSSIYPQGIWGSKIADLYRWDRPTPGRDTDALFTQIVSDVLEDIRGFAPMRVGLIFTGQGEWVLRGSQGEAVNRTNLDLKRQSAWGSSWLNPIPIGNGVIFNTAKSNMVRDIYPLYGLYTDTWDGDEISWQARHLFENHTLVSWGFQSTPFAVLWMVREDGVLISLTYDRKREVISWAQHVTDGAFETVCVVPEPPEDAVYVVVRRTQNGTTVRWFERMANPIQPADGRYAVQMDSTTIFDGHVIDGTTVQLSGGSYNLDDVVMITSSAPKFAAGDVGQSSVVLGDSVVVRIQGFTDASHVQGVLGAALTTAQIASWVTAPTTAWGIGRSVYGISRLVGWALDSGTPTGARGIAVVADGNAVTPASWDGTTLTLTDPALVVQIGLAANADLTTLDAFHPQLEIRSRKKLIKRIGVQTVNSRGLWGGADLDHLFELERDPDQLTGYFELFVTDEWDTDGAVSLRQWQPFPMMVTMILREVALGGS